MTVFAKSKLGAISDLSGAERWTGEALWDAAARRANVLAKAVTVPRPMVVIAHGNSPSFFADLFAVWAVGGCAVCVNQGLTPDELERVVSFVEASAVLVDGDEDFAASVPVLRLAEGAKNEAPQEDYAAQLDDPAIILFTSGTTGDPKGVVHTHRSLSARIALNAAHIGPDVLQTTLCTLPTHFGHGLIGNCLTPLLNGGDVIIGSGGGMALARDLGKIIDERGVTFMSSVPALWKLAKRVSQPPTKGTLQRVHIGSAPLSADLWQDVIAWCGDADVVNMYGITETANWIGGASSKQHAPQDGLLGTPWGGSFGVLQDDGSVLTEGTGEIVIAGPSLLQGYHKRPDLTAQVMHNGWYRTGDTGTLDAQGVLRLTGRNRYMINNAGIKIYPEELDLLFERHEDVAEACAFGIADAVSGEAVALAVAPVEGKAPTPQALQSWAVPRIRPEAVPRKVYIVDQIPKTDRGKINRDRVATYCQESEAK